MRRSSHILILSAISLILLIRYGNCGTHDNQIVGGFSEEKPVTEEVRKMVASAACRDEIDASLRSSNTLLNSEGVIRIVPKSYRTQLVNGVNYFIKIRVRVGNSKSAFYHIRIFRDFQGNANFVGIQGPKQRRDRLQYF